MSGRFQRVFRDSPISPQQAAEDEGVRRAIEAEFPPASAPVPIDGPLSVMLKDAMRSSGKSAEQIAAEVHAPPSLIAQFLAGQRDIHMATADRIAALLGLNPAVN